jgi:nicotinamidase-related amidase
MNAPTVPHEQCCPELLFERMDLGLRNAKSLRTVADISVFDHRQKGFDLPDVKSQTNPLTRRRGPIYDIRILKIGMMQLRHIRCCDNVVQTLKWSLRMNHRSAIIVIDLLKGFFKKNPTLPDPLDEKTLFANVKTVVDKGRGLGVNIVFIKDNFVPEEIPIDKHFKIFGPHCIIGTPDAEVVDELAPLPGDFQIQKKHYSSFNSTRLDAVLRELDVKRLYITGAWTEACVQHTVVDAFYLNYEINVISDAVSSPHRDAHDYALRYMSQYHRAKIMTTADAVGEFQRNESKPSAATSEGTANPSYAEWQRAAKAS